MKYSRDNHNYVATNITQMIQTSISVLISRFSPTLFWAVCSRKWIKTPTDSKQILILDCDTDLDIQVVSLVYKNLKLRGIHPIFAVPGEMLEKGEAVYKEIFNSGAEFINHGYVQHSIVDLERTAYRSTYFYHNISEDNVMLDIIHGHETFYNIFNQYPKGFRTPHFGTYQNSKQLSFLHKLLKKLEYEFSTSTGPEFYFRKGYLFIKNGIKELPVNGSLNYPMVIPDSFTYRFTESATFTPQEYVKELSLLAEGLSKNKLKRLNIYVDPSQVYDWEEFFIVMEKFAPFNVASLLEYSK